jgi:hypothetical protein
MGRISEYFEKRNQEKQQKADSAIDSALHRLSGLSGAKAFVAFEELEALVKKSYKTEASKKLDELLDSISFDKSRVESKLIGALVNWEAGVFSSGAKNSIRVYRDWVIAGKVAYDFDVSTRGEVTIDGAITIDKYNNKVDNRKASLQLATQDWSHSFSIVPQEADEARRILNQLNAIIEQLKPKAVSAEEISQMIEGLLTTSGKSPAEKLEELSNLRYQRLLSDKEFELAKTRILGI